MMVVPKVFIVELQANARQCCIACSSHVVMLQHEKMTGRGMFSQCALIAFLVKEEILIPDIHT